MNGFPQHLNRRISTADLDRRDVVPALPRFAKKMGWCFPCGGAGGGITVEASLNDEVFRRVKVNVSTERLHSRRAHGRESVNDAHADAYARLLLDAARHIEELERGLMGLARLPVQAHAARLGLLHELLGRCGQGLAGELKVAAALRSAGAREVMGADLLPTWELSD